jgi:hypothetical protein
LIFEPILLLDKTNSQWFGNLHQVLQRKEALKKLAFTSLAPTLAIHNIFGDLGKRPATISTREQI